MKTSRIDRTFPLRPKGLSRAERDSNFQTFKLATSISDRNERAYNDDIITNITRVIIPSHMSSDRRRAVEDGSNRSLTSSMLAVQSDELRDYASDREEGDLRATKVEEQPSSSSSSSLSHDPYARSRPTLRGALAAVGSTVKTVRKPFTSHSTAASHSQPFGQRFAMMDPFQRHKMLAEEYIKYYRGSAKDIASPAQTVKTDMDVVKENYRFVRSSEDDLAAATGNSEQRLAKRYWDRLYKEYALADMSRYRTGEIGLRWRTEQEVIDGRGQFTCGNKKCPTQPPATPNQLKSFELNFCYVEGGVSKQTLVKVRLCPDCTYRLHYPKLKQMEEEEKARKRQAREERRKKRKDEKKAKKEKLRSSSSSKKDKKKKRRHDSQSSSSSSGSDSSSDSESDNHSRPNKKVRYVSPVGDSSISDQATASSSSLMATSSLSDRFTLPQSSNFTPSQPIGASSSSTPLSPLDEFANQYFPQLFP